MEKLRASYNIITPISEGGVQELKYIEYIARKCYKSEDKITEDGESAKKIIKLLLDRHHEAMIEHSFLSVEFMVDRGVSHEMVRHRLASFAQESTRYVNYSKEKFGKHIKVIDPTPGIMIENEKRDECNKLSAEQINDILDEWYQAMLDAEKHYLKMCDLGASPQIARGVLPNSTKTEIVISANYREWRNIFKLRTPATAHPQMREVMMKLCKEVKERIPLIFDDIDV